MIKIEKKEFDLGQIEESGQCFRWKKKGEIGYLIPAGGRLLLAEEGEDHIALHCSEEEFLDYWENYFDLATDYGSICATIDPKDQFLKEASIQGRGIRILRQDSWEMLITFLLSQRKSIPAIKTAIEKLCQAAGRPLYYRWEESEECIYAFPDPADLLRLSSQELSDCGLGYRAKYIRGAAEAFAYGDRSMESFKELEDEALLLELKGLFGVGDKVASCVALFGFHRLDAFPKDVWINRVLDAHYKEGFPFARYAPYNGVIQQYLFYARKAL